MDIVYLFAALGVSSVLWSCAQALSVRLTDKYSDEKSIPFYLNWLFYICAFLGILGVFAHPFDDYLKTRFYNRMMNRVRSARYLAELITYPPDYMCDQYGFDYPSQEDRADLKVYYENLKESQEFYVANKLYSPSVLYDNKPLDKFNDWRNHEYTKLGL